MGWLRNPEKAAYNKVYNKMSFSLKDLLKVTPRKKCQERQDVI